MSASLVGSEMCIRDRSRVARREQSGGGRHLLLQRALGGRRARATGPPPVSYTHLTLPTICSV
eukprot:674681-Alexandrium_andersonii.AAC.1